MKSLQRRVFHYPSGTSSGPRTGLQENHHCRAWSCISSLRYVSVCKYKFSIVLELINAWCCYRSLSLLRPHPLLLIHSFSTWKDTQVKSSICSSSLYVPSFRFPVILSLPTLCHIIHVWLTIFSSSQGLFYLRWKKPDAVRPFKGTRIVVHYRNHIHPFSLICSMVAIRILLLSSCGVPCVFYSNFAGDVN